MTMARYVCVAVVTLLISVGHALPVTENWSSYPTSNLPPPGPPATPCYTPPSSASFNLSGVTYDYPNDAINKELIMKPNLLAMVFNARKTNGRQNLYGRGLRDTDPKSCTPSEITLEGFHWKGGHCWVVFPKFQDVTFVTCGFPTCVGSSGIQTCLYTDYPRPVWAYCLALPYGDRITSVSVPIPTRCACAMSSC